MDHAKKGKAQWSLWPGPRRSHLDAPPKLDVDNLQRSSRLTDSRDISGRPRCSEAFYIGHPFEGDVPQPRSHHRWTSEAAQLQARLVEDTLQL